MHTKLITAVTLAGSCLLGIAFNPTFGVPSAGVAIAIAGAAPAVAADPEADVVETVADTLADLRAFERRTARITGRMLAATVSVSLGANEGSGVIVSPDGYVLTVGHVFEPPDLSRATVRMADGRRIGARALGCIFDRDIGLLKLDDAGPWPYAEMGSIESLEEGSPCFALGHTGGYDPHRPAVLRAGQISAFQSPRRGWSRGRFLESSCIINKGDSGGPLFDADGNVIGIHSRIYERLHQNLHVPIDVGHDNWDRLVAGERWRERAPSTRFRRDSPYFGVQVQNIDGKCVVDSVVPGLPAHRAGIRSGDVITRLGSTPIRSTESLTYRLQRMRVGGTVDVAVQREGEIVEIEVALERRPTETRSD